VLLRGLAGYESWAIKGRNFLIGWSAV
jgi:hypothetical protein